ncbi:MAG: DUF2971 domain-containing protein [Rhodoluna sp.]
MRSIGAKAEQLSYRLIDAGWAQSQDDEPELLYHYTSSAGLQGILSNKNILLTERRFMNDVSESLLGKEIILSIINSRIKSSNDSKIRNFYEKLLKSFISPAQNNFIFSLSDKGDDLTQWRSYASDGEGFAIAFDVAAIKNRSATNEFGFGKILYNRSSYVSKINNAIDSFVSMYDELNDEDSVKWIPEIVLECDATIDAIACAYKHSSFRSEREWRINRYPDEESEIRIRESKNKLIPNIAINLGHEEHPIGIKRIGIGPGFKDPSIRYAVEILCKNAGLSVEIYNADTPYRRL